MQHEITADGKKGLYNDVLHSCNIFLSSISKAIGWVVLFVIFFGLFMPVGLIMRMLGVGRMGRYWESTVDSYRILSKARGSSHMDSSF